VLLSGVQSRRFSICNPQYPAGCSIVLSNLHEWRERGAGKKMVRMREDRGCCEGAAKDHPVYVHIRMLQACMPNECKNSLLECSI